MTASPDFRSSRRAHPFDFDEFAFRVVRHALVGHQAQEAEVGARLVVGGHESALALPAHDQVLGGQLVDGLAHRALADLETLGQLNFARDQLARLPLAHCRLCVISALICWYKGEKVGELPGEFSAPLEDAGPATGAIAQLALAAVEVLLWLGGTGFIDQDFTTNTPPRPAKPTDNLAVLYKT